MFLISAGFMECNEVVTDEPCLLKLVSYQFKTREKCSKSPFVTKCGMRTSHVPWFQRCGSLKSLLHGAMAVKPGGNCKSR